MISTISKRFMIFTAVVVLATNSTKNLKLPGNKCNNFSTFSLLKKLYRNYKEQNKTFLTLIQNTTKLNQTSREATRSGSNSKTGVGVLSMGLTYLDPWHAKCIVKIFFVGRHYGCYCGAGNTMDNGEPQDDIDSVCLQHDACYGNIEPIENCTLKNGANYTWTDNAGQVI